MVTQHPDLVTEVVAAIANGGVVSPVLGGANEPPVKRPRLIGIFR